MMDNSDFATLLLSWWDQNRRDLPWRGETDPYRIFVSEIMLQQTRVETVLKSYARFIARFPTVQALSDAKEDEVLKAWEGLGYYARARNMHAAAKLVSFELNGCFPKSRDGLFKLPGIGPYASAAIASIAWSECVPAMDANLARVISRYLASEKLIDTPQALFPEAQALLSPDRPGDHNQAMMDLGATICLQRKPRCTICPLNVLCKAHIEGMETEYPRKLPPIEKREERRTVLLVSIEGRLAIQKRPSGGMLGGLWEFPSVEGECSPEEAETALREMGFAGLTWVRELPHAKHVFTHRIWQMTGHLFSAQSSPEDVTMADAVGLDVVAFPSALRVYREAGMRLLMDCGYSVKD